MSKREFLDNLRVARNLLVHGDVTTGSRQLDPAALAQALTRAAIWLTPSAVKGFRADDFQELGAAPQRAVADAVQEFERVAKQVPPDAPATDQQYINVSTTRGVATVALRPYVARNFEHRHMLAVCKKYTGLAVDGTGQPVPAEITRIADSFVQLQNARHKADYNVKDSVTPLEAQTFVQMARDAFTD